MTVPISIMFILLQCICGSGVLPVPDHAIYISVVEINHLKNSAEAELRIKVFSDDLQSAVVNAGGQMHTFPIDSICTSGRSAVISYLLETTALTINGKDVRPEFTGCEQHNDTHWLEFSVAVPESWQTLSVEATYFMELFPTQSQMLHITNGEAKRTLRIHKGDPLVSCTF